MPFVETTTSQQDGSYDSDGYYSMTRTFKVWQVSPVAFLADPTTVAHRDAYATPPVADKMPQWGSEITAVSGPNPILAPSGERVGIALSVTLYKWTLQPVSAVLFIAIAHYSNDPRIAPIGSTYAQHSQYQIVDIPIVRKMFILSTGSSTQNSPFAWVESTVPAYRPIRRISQTVCIRRGLRKSVEQVVDQNAGKIVQLRNLPGYVRFEGADMRSRGAQWLDVTYNFTQEILVKEFADLISPDENHRNQLAQARESYLFPPGARYASSQTAGEVFFLPAYHTVELIYLLPGNNADPQPMWIYRLKGAFPEPGQYLSLPGEAWFEWNVTL